MDGRMMCAHTKTTLRARGASLAAAAAARATCFCASATAATATVSRPHSALAKPWLRCLILHTHLRASPLLCAARRVRGSSQHPCQGAPGASHLCPATCARQRGRERVMHTWCFGGQRGQAGSSVRAGSQAKPAKHTQAKKQRRKKSLLAHPVLCATAFCPAPASLDAKQPSLPALVARGESTPSHACTRRGV